MANVKITQLPLATTPLTGTEDIPLVQGTTTKQVTVEGLFTSPVMTNPRLGTVGQADLINATGLPISTGVAGLGTGIATFLGTPSSTNLRAAVTDETGTGSLVFATNPVLVTPNLGTPTFLVATNATGTALGLIAGSAVTNANLTGAVTSVGNATSLGSFTSAQLATALTDETGSGANVFATSPTLVTPALGTPSAAVLTFATGLPLTTGVTGTLPILNGGTGQTTANAAFNALAPSQTGNSGKYLTTDGSNSSWATNPLGTVTSVGGTGTVNGITLTGTVTSSGNLTLGGTLSNVSLTSQVTGTLPTANGGTNLTSFTSGGVVYASSSSALATGSALTFDGTALVVGSSTFPDGRIRLKQASDTTNQKGLLIENAADDSFLAIGAKNNVFTYSSTYNSTGSYKPQAWLINDIEQMRLTSSSLYTASGINVAFGTSSIGARLTTQASANSYTAGAFQINSLSGTYKSYITNVGGLLLFSNSSTVDQLILDSSGNLGLGVTPSAWSGIKVLQVGSYGGLYNLSTAVGVSNNFYYDGTNARYINTSAASYYSQSGNVHGWYQAASGTAGNTISFTQAMTLDANSNLTLGQTTSTARLTVQSGVANGTVAQFGGSSGGSDPRGLTIKTFSSNGGGDCGVDFNAAINNTSYGSFKFSAGSATLASIDSSGNLLVGTTSQYISSFTGITIEGKTSGTGNNLSLGLNKAGTPQILSGDVLGNIYFYGVDNDITAGNNNIGARIASIATSNWTTDGTTSNAALAFYTHGTTSGAPEERARIDSSGRLLVSAIGGVSGGFGKITVRDDSGVPIMVGNEAASGNFIQFSGNGSGVVGSITFVGSATLYNTTSDQRLKENIVDAPDFGSVIDSIQVRSFDWKANNAHQRAGFIAQELVTVAPEAVHQPTDTEEMMAVDYSKLVPMLVKEIQSLRQRLSAANF